MSRTVVALFLILVGGCAPLRTAPGAPAAAAPTLAAELDSLLADSLFLDAHWGVLVRSLSSGETLYARNAERNFVPASALKMVTGAAALELLGPEHRFRTEILTSAPVRDGVLRGDLVVRGGGDPTLSGRFHETPRALFRAWADSLRSQGIRRVSGAVVGLDGVFADPPFGRGWMWDDLDAPYAAEIGGLVFNEGATLLRVHPSRRAGGPAIISAEPASGYVRIVNRVITGEAGDSAWLQVTREPAGPGMIVTGRIPPDTFLTRAVAVREPARYFATVLRETLREAGIPVDGPIFVEGDRTIGEMDAGALRPLFVHRSPPLAEILPAMMHPSQNLMAEMLLRSLGSEVAGSGTAVAGAGAVQRFLAMRGVRPAGRIADGSGLSTYNLISPRTVAELLETMAGGTHAEVWREALPAAGVHGTLANRLRGTPLEGSVRAKTGTLTGVRALAGYLPTEAGDTLVFVFLVNSHTRAAAQADRVIDAALLRLHREPARRTSRGGAARR
jgi:serine-type D-Ala-D-Ala carboxypeptidase/endopeptidase (penicillin-binding protein 4)